MINYLRELLKTSENEVKRLSSELNNISNRPQTNNLNEFNKELSPKLKCEWIPTKITGYVTAINLLNELTKAYNSNQDSGDGEFDGLHYVVGELEQYIQFNVEHLEMPIINLRIWTIVFE